VLSASQLKEYKTCGCGPQKSMLRQPVPRYLRRKYPLTVKSWEAMLARCHYSKTKQNCYKGIEICDEWFSFDVFLNDMGPRPSILYSIDRKNSKGGYCKSNCQRITKRENSAKVDRTCSPERRKKISQGVKLAHSKGLILTTEARLKIGLGGSKRRGRHLQQCSKCGKKSYLAICQRCRGQNHEDC
jgi:hypothetical protein